MSNASVDGQLGSIGYILGVFESNIYTRGAKIRILRPLLSRLDPGGIDTSWELRLHSRAFAIAFDWASQSR